MTYATRSTTERLQANACDTWWDESRQRNNKLQTNAEAEAESGGAVIYDTSSTAGRLQTNAYGTRRYERRQRNRLQANVKTGSVDAVIDDTGSAVGGLQANAYDTWWYERRQRSKLHAKARSGNAVTCDTGGAVGRAAARAARAEAAKKMAAAAKAAGNTLELDQDFQWHKFLINAEVGETGWVPPASSSVGRVLTEFVGSKYANALFNTYGTVATDYAEVRGIFDCVRLRDGVLELTLKNTYANVEGLMDRLAVYLRARLPQLTGIHQMHREGMNIL